MSNIYCNAKCGNFNCPNILTDEIEEKYEFLDKPIKKVNLAGECENYVELKLKPCPFCGGTELFIGTEAEISERSDEDASSYYTVVCDFKAGGCGATSGFRKYKDDAIRAWNMRTEDNSDVTFFKD